MKILTYNVLADSTLHHFGDLIKQYPEYFLRDNRQKLIISELIKYDCDVICLQEVDELSFKFYSENLINYKGQLSLHENKKFGNCIFVKTKLELHIDKIKLPNSKRYIQLLYFNGYNIINCHLDFNYNIEQCKFILDTLGIDQELKSIVCGDFNGSDNIFRKFKNYGFNSEITLCTCITKGEVKLIDFIFFKNIIYSSIKTNSTLKYGELLPNDTQGSDHIPIIAEFS